MERTTSWSEKTVQNKKSEISRQRTANLPSYKEENPQRPELALRVDGMSNPLEAKARTVGDSPYPQIKGKEKKKGER